MFDVYEFFNSRDVAKHLKEIGYKFTPLEKAYVVYHSDRKRYAEKKDAWLELIEATDDFLIKARNCLWNKDIMFHAAVRRYVDYVDYCFEQLQRKEAGYVYESQLFASVEPDFDSACGASKYECQEYFDSYEGCLKFCKATLAECSEDYDRFRIRKIKLNVTDPHEEIAFVFDGKGMFDLHSCEIADIWNRFSEGGDCIDSFFDSFWFAFPLPFEKGDMVCKWDGTMPCLFVSAPNDMSDRRYAYHLDHGDWSDMMVSSYFLTKDGRLYFDASIFLTDLEYYRGGFDGTRNFLRIASKHMKDEIPIDLFINGIMETQMDKIKSELKKDYSLFLPDDLVAIGLKDKKDK